MLNIVTPCSRPENLQKLYESIKSYGDKEKIWWYIVYDAEQGERKFKHIPWVREFWLDKKLAGYPQRNLALSIIEEGWVWVLDDDNLLHPQLVKELENITDPNVQGVLFKQQFNNGCERGIDPRHCHIDQAQFVLKKELIVDKRYDEMYTADGKFLEELYNANKEKFIRIEKILCFYNRLR
jgi:hypothetical protein